MYKLQIAEKRPCTCEKCEHDHHKIVYLDVVSRWTRKLLTYKSVRTAELQRRYSPYKNDIRIVPTNTPSNGTSSHI